MTNVRAFRVGPVDGQWSRRIEQITIDDLSVGDTVIEVEYSSINFKDGLASSEKGRVARIDPLVPGVDLAGSVVSSDDPALTPGMQVIAHGYDIGVAHSGGFATHARVPSSWIVPMPAELSTRTAMLLGTAGYTAGLSVEALEQHGLTPGSGPVLVTGATGGVGSSAVGMLAARGYEVVASTGKPSSAGWLTEIGAAQVIDRATLTPESIRPLEREQWAGVVDCVGGTTLAYALATCRYGCSVAASGLTGGTNLPTTVMPFILRGVNLLGIDSVQTPIDQRRAMWQRLGTDLKPSWLDSLPVDEVGLDDLSRELDRIASGEMQGRMLVRPSA